METESWIRLITGIVLSSLTVRAVIIYRQLMKKWTQESREEAKRAAGSMRVRVQVKHVGIEQQLLDACAVELYEPVCAELLRLERGDAEQSALYREQLQQHLTRIGHLPPGAIRQQKEHEVKIKLKYLEAKHQDTRLGL